ncbi:hypothetical protein ACOMHN_039716 [Nucella lapillus]
MFPAISQVVKDPSKIAEGILEPLSPNSATGITAVKWRKIQKEDKNLACVMDHLERGKRMESKSITDMNPELQVYIREQTKLVLKNGVTYRNTVDQSGQAVLQLVIPASQRKDAMKGVHEDLFHTHFDDAIRQARRRFFWPFMATDIKRKIERCLRCKRSKARPQKAEMQTITTTCPLELLSIDFLTIEVKGMKQNILVVMDHFTKFAQAFLTKDQTARTVARTLWNEFFLIYGFPSRIHSDQGRDFESKLLKEVCTMAGIAKTRTSPYHPAGNPVERYNRTLIGMLRTLEEEQKQDWRKSLRSVVHAYNSCIHESTGFSPYYLFFGRHPKLPIDLAFGIELNEGKQSTRHYVKELKHTLQEAYQRAYKQMEKRADQNKARYNASAHAMDLDPGDRILVRNVGHRLKSKVSDRWESDIYIVVSKAEGLPVYTVVPEVGSGTKRTLHRNMLLPIGMLGDPPPTQPELPSQRTTRTAPKIHSLEREALTQEGYDIGETVEVVVRPNISELRPDAAAFIPGGRPPESDITNPASDGAGVVHTDIVDSEKGGSESATQGRRSAIDVDGGQEEALEEIQNETPSTEREVESGSGTDTEDGSLSETDTESIDEENVITAPSPVPAPRRSLRQSRPVERLNLVHQWTRRDQNSRTVDESLVETVRRKLNALRGHSIPGTQASMIEYTLSGVLQCL